MKRKELKKCPFCGGEATFYGVDSYYVACCRCEAQIARYRTAQEAVAVWNCRTPEKKALTCGACVHRGLYEDALEYGYPSPCTGC